METPNEKHALMKLDAVRNAREIRQAADLAVAVAIGWLASAAFAVPEWLMILAALGVCRPLRQQPEGTLWKKPTIRLAFLALVLTWLVSDWSSYRQGVFEGYDAAVAAATR